MKKLIRIGLVFFIVFYFVGVGISQFACGSDLVLQSTNSEQEEQSESGPSCPSIYKNYNYEIPVIVHALYNDTCIIQ